MTSGENIREGARVIDSHQKTLGSVGTVHRDPVSGEVETFTVKQGRWVLAKTKVMSVDLVKQVNRDPDTVVLALTKADFRAMPKFDAGAEPVS